MSIIVSADPVACPGRKSRLDNKPLPLDKASDRRPEMSKLLKSPLHSIDIYGAFGVDERSLVEKMVARLEGGEDNDASDARDLGTRGARASRVPNVRHRASCLVLFVPLIVFSAILTRPSAKLPVKNMCQKNNTAADYNGKCGAQKICLRQYIHLRS